MSTLKAGDPVVVAGSLGRVQRLGTQGRAKGAFIHFSGAYTNFASDWQIKPAVIGVNVCPQAKGTHSCGLVHVDAAELERLR